MKNIIIIALISLISTVDTFAQENKISKHELSIVIDDIFVKSYYNNMYLDKDMYYYNILPENALMPKLGLGYKFHFSKSAIRLTNTFAFSNYQQDNEVSYKNENTVIGLNSFIGYELHKNFNKTQFFYGLDASLKYYKSKSKSENYHNNPVYINTYKEVFKAYGIAPFFGIKYYITPNISLSTELKFLVQSYNKEYTSSSTYNNSENKSTVKGINYQFDPLGQLSINIHL